MSSQSSSITVIDEEESTGQKENVAPVRAPPTGGLQAVMRRHRSQNTSHSTGHAVTATAAEPVAFTTVSETLQPSRSVTASTTGSATNLSNFVDLTGDDSDDDANTGAAAIPTATAMPTYHYRGSKSNVTLPNPPEPPRNSEDYPAPTELPWDPKPVPSLYLSNRKIDGRDVDNYYSLVASASRPSASSTGTTVTPCPKPSFAADLDLDDLYGDLRPLDSKPVLSPVKMPCLNSTPQPGPSGLSNVTASTSTGGLDLVLTSDEDDDTPIRSLLSSMSGPSVSSNERSRGKKRSSSRSVFAEDPTVRKKTNTKRRPM